MLVNMTPLSLLFILFIAGVYGQSGFGVSYGSPHICALQGSAVTMSCTFSYPYRSYVVRAFWTKIQVREENEEFPDLSVDPEYSQRIQYVLNNQWNFNLRLSHVTKKDEREYYCRFTTEIAANKWIGIPGVRLSVTDLQLESPERVTEGDSVRLTCNSSCKLTDTPTFIWYRNSQRITGNIHHELLVHQVRRGLTDNYSCGVLGSFYISPVVSFDVRSFLPKISSIAITEYEGKSITFRTSYTEGFETNSKYFSRSDTFFSEKLVETSESNRWTTHGRFAIFDNTSAHVIIATILNLTMEDSGSYTVGVDVTLLPDYDAEIQLTVMRENHDTTTETHNTITETYNTVNRYLSKSEGL
nr:uncharacterized protein LOC110439990 [Danio rerio]|eukprot:XP_021333852.1 uncharacterized protein LOC110439990 [Danio rerio]